MTKLALAPLLLTVACSPPSLASDSANERADRIGEEAMAIANVMDETELQLLTKRVIALERRIDELDADPQTIEVRLLRARLEKLEAKMLTPAYRVGEKFAVAGPNVEIARDQTPE